MQNEDEDTNDGPPMSNSSSEGLPLVNQDSEKLTLSDKDFDIETSTTEESNESSSGFDPLTPYNFSGDDDNIERDSETSDNSEVPDDDEIIDDDSDESTVCADSSNFLPQPRWYSLRQLTSREYGRLVKPAVINDRPSYYPFDSFWFRRYANHSLHFMQKLELNCILEKYEGCVNAVDFSSKGDLICSGGDDLKVHIYDWKRAKLKQRYTSGHSLNVFQTRWCLDDSCIITCAQDGRIIISDIQNIEKSQEVIVQHRLSAHKLTFSEPRTVLSSGEDGAVFEIDLREFKPRELLKIRNEQGHIPLYSINCNMIFSPCHFVVCGRSSSVFIYDRRFLQSPVSVLFPHHISNSTHFVTCAVYNSNATKLLMSYNDENMYVFDVKSEKQEHTYLGHRNACTIKGCSWFGDDFVLSGSDDGYIYGWERNSERVVIALKADETGGVNVIEPHPSLPVLATSGIDYNVKIWTPTLKDWPMDLTGVRKRMRQNLKKRATDSAYPSENENMILMVMEQLRRGMSNANERQYEDGSDDEGSDYDSCAPS